MRGDVSFDNPGRNDCDEGVWLSSAFILITTIPSLLFAPRLSTTLYASLSCPVNAEKDNKSLNRWFCQTRLLSRVMDLLV